VTIVVEAPPDAKGRGRKVRVEADYPSGDAPRRHRFTKRTTVDVKTD
jgi:hypothetical protein